MSNTYKLEFHMRQLNRSSERLQTVSPYRVAWQGHFVLLSYTKYIIELSEKQNVRESATNSCKFDIVLFGEWCFRFVKSTIYFLLFTLDITSTRYNNNRVTSVTVSIGMKVEKLLSFWLFLYGGLDDLSCRFIEFFGISVENTFYLPFLAYSFRKFNVSCCGVGDRWRKQQLSMNLHLKKIKQILSKGNFFIHEGKFENLKGNSSFAIRTNC